MFTYEPGNRISVPLEAEGEDIDRAALTAANEDALSFARDVFESQRDQLNQLHAEWYNQIIFAHGNQDHAIDTVTGTPVRLPAEGVSHLRLHAADPPARHLQARFGADEARSARDDYGHHGHRGRAYRDRHSLVGARALPLRRTERGASGLEGQNRKLDRLPAVDAERGPIDRKPGDLLACRR